MPCAQTCAMSTAFSRGWGEAGLAPQHRGATLWLSSGNPQFLLQHPNGLSPTPRRPPLAPTYRLILDLRDHLKGDKDRPTLTEDVPYLGAERLEIIEVIGGGIARLFRHAGVVNVLRVGHRLPTCGGVTLVVQ